MKICSKCKKLKEIENFSKSGKYYNSWCHLCRKNSEQEKLIKLGIIPKPKPKVIDDKNKECIKCNKILHINFFNKNTRGRLNRNPYCKICESNYNKSLRRGNPKKYKEISRNNTKRYREGHREHWNGLHRINQFNRKRKIKAKLDGTVTEDFMISLYKIKTCFWCKKYIKRKDRTAEHIIPLDLGGNHSIINLTMACKSCNSSKLNFKLKCQ